MNRRAGILLPITSLPSKYGIGCFSKSAYEFVDWLKEAGQSYWQILPLGPTGFGDSPYQSFSTYAGNPYLISLEQLVEEGVLSTQECEGVDFGFNEEDIDYEKLYINRYKLLKKAYSRTNLGSDSLFVRFVEKNKWWLEDFALFMSIKEAFNGKSWLEWDEKIKRRDEDIINKYSRSLRNEIMFWKYTQYKFFEQWKKLKAYANKQGIEIIGDIPIYVALDSSDVWSRKELFQIMDDKPTAVAGCPPDGFSKTGQLWGNPLYKWEVHKEDGYGWWINRIKFCFGLYDVLRIDHFRGFDEYYSISYGEETAVNGQWKKGPGIDLFNRIKEELGDINVIAEDLGFMTDTVRELVKATGFPGMKVLEFAFDSRDTGCSSDYLPHNYDRNCAVYTGTHDNQTLVSWLSTISDLERSLVREYLCDEYTPNKQLYKALISLIMRSNAKMCIIPLQDYLGYNDYARINTPSTIGMNWRWRVNKAALTNTLAKEIKEMTNRYGRNNK